MQNTSKQSNSSANRAQILNLILASGALSRIDLANTMHITKASITLITNELIQDGILYEKGSEPQTKKVSRGRRKILLDINENARLSFGAVLDKNYLYLGLTNLKGETLDKRKILIEDKSYHDILSCIVSEIDALKGVNCLSKGRILGLGICIGNGGASFVDGNSVYDKLVRVKKDLTHAIDMPICAHTVINGAILAQLIFSDRQPAYKNLLMIRYGDIIESGVLLNGTLYIPSITAESKSSTLYGGLSQYAGGFAQMQCININADYKENSYSSYLLAHSISCEDEQDKLKKLLMSNLSADINTCYTVLQPEAVLLFGSFFETDNTLAWINTILETNYRQKPSVSIGIVTESTVYLAACAAAVSKFFYCKE